MANCRQAPCVKIATLGLSWGTPHERHTHTHTHTHGFQRIPAFSFHPLNKGSDDSRANPCVCVCVCVCVVSLVSSGPKGKALKSVDVCMCVVSHVFLGPKRKMLKSVCVCVCVCVWPGGRPSPFLRGETQIGHNRGCRVHRFPGTPTSHIQKDVFITSTHTHTHLIRPSL